MDTEKEINQIIWLYQNCLVSNDEALERLRKLDPEQFDQFQLRASVIIWSKPADSRRGPDKESKDFPLDL